MVNAKDVKITVFPSDAQIYVDGTYKADGIYTASLKKKDEFIVIKIEKTGYAPLETKFFYNDKRKDVFYMLKEDESLKHSVASANVNQGFTVNVNPKYDAESAWKMINQVVLTYSTHRSKNTDFEPVNRRFDFRLRTGQNHARTIVKVNLKWHSSSKKTS